MSVQTVQDDVAASVLGDLMGIWLAQQPSTYTACRRLHTALTPLSDAWVHALAGALRTDNTPDAEPLAQHIDAFVATFDDLADEGRELADCGIADNGLMTLPDWIDWQCFIADTYVKDKARIRRAACSRLSFGRSTKPRTRHGPSPHSASIPGRMT
ncbi:hypothetical protein [Aureimonas leprariae]|uniref:Uncharacterized protein n=1 Tax=Plantimonas leprariae TaxID=2615207 RepID=A0A7V7PPY2_9HYPH|nr:hypothetical protein [Aureimonas leprariae]KAB0680163.1 hypothetical protein F6X38_08205 [Aureimonas leprariae]